MQITTASHRQYVNYIRGGYSTCLFSPWWGQYLVDLYRSTEIIKVKDNTLAEPLRKAWYGTTEVLTEKRVAKYPWPGGKLHQIFIRGKQPQETDTLVNPQVEIEDALFSME